jgi:alpha-beta hydrolase superfamily lysophospholipase
MLLLVPAVVVGGLIAVAAYNSHLCKTTPETTYEYELWGKKVLLGIPKDKFPTPKEIDDMENMAPGGEHGWFTSPSAGKQLHYRKYMPKNKKKPKAIVIFHHGIQAHSGAAWITTKNRKLSLAAQIEEYVTKQGFALYAMDQLGHGYSEGRRMFVSDYKHNVLDLTFFCRLAASYHDDTTPLFLKGHSFGACLALHAAHEFENNASAAPKGYKGICIISPAIVGDLPPPPVTFTLRYLLAPNYPSWVPPFMPNPVSPDRVWRDPEALAWNTGGRYMEMGLEKAGVPFNLGTAVQLLRATEDVRDTVIPALKTPFCAVHGIEDYAVPIEGTNFLEKHAVTAKEDQSILRIEGAYHDLLADPAMEETLAHLIEFMNARIAKKK